MDDDGFYDDRVPADPEIRRAYQGALGRLIMAHNEVDFWMTVLLVKSADKISPEGDLKEITLGSFAQRASNLMILMRVAPRLLLGGVGNGRLLELNNVRNDLAHAHFDQDHFKDSFAVIKARHHSLKKKRLSQYSTDTINEFAVELENIASHMRTVDIFFDVSLPDDEGVASSSRSLSDDT